jgi:hypothetical protein
MFPGIGRNLCPADRTCALFAIGNRKSRIAIVAVPVVRRMESPLGISRGIYFAAGACAA